MPYKDAQANKESQARYKLNTLNRRRHLLSQFACRSCGNLDPSIIQWHHVDPETKEFDVWQTAWAEEKFWNEILKCVPLCANCHVKIHREELCLINPIG